MTFGRKLERPVAGIALGSGLLITGISWTYGGMTTARDLGLARLLVLAVVLAFTVLLANKFPIYVRHNAKVCITSIPMYLLVVLLPPALAGAVAGLAVYAGETSVRSERGSRGSHIVTHAGRWMVLVTLASAVTHAVSPQRAPIVVIPLLVLAALILFIGDVLTLPLTVSCITGDPPWRVIAACLRGGWAVEGAQYLVACVGGLAATHHLWVLTLLILPAVLVYLVYRKEIDPDTLELLESMADAVDLRNPYTVGHTPRVAALTDVILGELGMHGQEARFIHIAARLHDIGKAQLPDTLHRAGAPVSGQPLALSTHAELGAALLAGYPDIDRVVEMVRHHHERWDGTGYPDRLSGSAIPFGARIIAVANAFDSLTTDHSGRSALSIDQAAHMLLDGSSHQWDPEIVTVLLRHFTGTWPREHVSMASPQGAVQAT